MGKPFKTVVKVWYGKLKNLDSNEVLSDLVPRRRIA